MGNKSNLNGRSFEYILTKEIQKKFGVKLTPRAIKDQKRDVEKILKLSESIKQDMEKGSIKIVDWLSNNFFDLNNNNLILDRLPDSESKKGNPTDIQLISNDTIINLSLKHNHKALKHQRPSSLAQQCGISKNDEKDKVYRANLKQISNSFFQYAKSIHKSPTKFSDLTLIDNKVVDRLLYKPVCDLVTNFVNSHCTAQHNTNHLFSFLMGTEDYHKVIVSADKVLIQHFSISKPPLNVRATVSANNRVELNFSNNWKLDMRIHTASSRTKGCEKSGCSLKFDTQGVNIFPDKEIEL
jgi:hypothetical protein